jgi:hypothetical protein
LACPSGEDKPTTGQPSKPQHQAQSGSRAPAPLSRQGPGEVGLCATTIFVRGLRESPGVWCCERRVTGMLGAVKGAFAALSAGNAPFTAWPVPVTRLSRHGDPRPDGCVFAVQGHARLPPAVLAADVFRGCHALNGTFETSHGAPTTRATKRASTPLPTQPHQTREAGRQLIRQHQSLPTNPAPKRATPVGLPVRRGQDPTTDHTTKSPAPSPKTARARTRARDATPTLSRGRPALPAYRDPPTKHRQSPRLWTTHPNPANLSSLLTKKTVN